ncbi:hypothetical protein C0992_010633 [Termitomyces sp. T32_za158]|nr:hypothetical protein C0992_010633 [Termitomyces sp. T32_za158]
MSSSKRKVKSAVTLHDFFDAAGQASSMSVKEKRKGTSRKSLVTPKDIIVIDDSDSEPEVVQVIRSTKKRRRSSSSGEVTFVENSAEPTDNVPVPPAAASDSFRKAEDITSPSGFKQKSSASVLFTPSPRPNGAAIKEETPTRTTTPFLLLNNGLSAGATTLTGELSPHSILSFGEPTLLLQNEGTTSLPNQGASTPRLVLSGTGCQTPEASDETKSTMDSYFSPDVGDDWGTGDDEITLAPVPDEEYENEDLTIIFPDDERVTNCPSCNMLFNGLSHLKVTKHINDCLDSRGCSVHESPPLAKSMDRIEVKPFEFLSCLAQPKIEGPPSMSSKEDTHMPPSNDNIFSVLMSSHKEKEAWKEATVVEKRDFRPNKGNGGRRKAPFYKILQGMPIAVDAFRYGTIPGVTAYFLTYSPSLTLLLFHSNASSSDMHTQTIIQIWLPIGKADPSTVRKGRQTVNAGDSSFKSPFVGSSRVFRYLHCGDFRASPRHVLHPVVKGKRIDYVYLDTTYLDPKYTFPPQPLVISACAELARRLVAGEALGHASTAMDKWTISKNTGNQSRTETWLIVVGTYLIGKERIVKAIAQALNSKVYCDPRKAAILRCQADAELDALLTANPLEATVHLVPLSTITSDKLKTYMGRFKGKFSKAAGFRATGWTYTPPMGTDQLPTIASIISHPHRGFTHSNLRPARQSTAALQLFPVPYSEHSSFFELTCFAMSFDWGKMIATVNVGSESSRSKMAKWVAKWEAERKKRGKNEVIPYRHIDYW